MSHARLSPSNHRWVHCPGSVREEQNYVDVAGAAAIDGTGSHLLLEMCLENGVRVETYIGQIIGVNHPDSPMGWMVHADRADRVQMCLDYVARRHAELSAQYPGADIRVEAESKADPGGMFGRDDWKGTADITITVVQEGSVLFVEICDYKDGRGYVSEKNNSQLVSYAGGKIRPYVASGPDLVRPLRPLGVRDGVRMTIVQPKTNTPVRYSDASTSELLRELEQLAQAAHATDAPDAPVRPGKHCQWCKASMKRGGHCSVEATQSLETVKNMSNDVIATDGGLFEQLGQLMGDVTHMTNDQLSQLASARDALNAAFDKVDTELTTRLEQGQSVAGFALKPGRSSRVWAKSEEDVVKALKGRRLKNADIYPPKLISVTQVMKLDSLTDQQKEKIERDLVTVKAGALKLTKVAHGEENNAETMFKDVAQCKTDVVHSVAQGTETVVKEVTPSVFAENDVAIEAAEPEVSFF